MVPEIELEDCRGVLEYLVLETWDGTERRSREFTATRKTKSATQWTPRKYTFGELELQCTCEFFFFFVSCLRVVSVLEMQWWFFQACPRHSCSNSRS